MRVFQLSNLKGYKLSFRKAGIIAYFKSKIWRQNLKIFSDKYEDKRDSEINDDFKNEILEQRRREGQHEKSEKWEETLSKQ